MPNHFRHRHSARLLLAFAAGCFLAAPCELLHAQPRKTSADVVKIKLTSADVVKVRLTATKADAEGKQTITLRLTIDKGWHIYANPVGCDDFKGCETTVAVTGKVKPVDVRTTYPSGKVLELFGLQIKIYENEVILKTQVQRAPGDTGSLQVTINLQASGAAYGLLPDRIKLTVPPEGH